MVEVRDFFRPGVVGGGPHAEREGHWREVHHCAVVCGEDFITDVEVEQ